MHASVETIRIELPTLGHHIALFHHRPEVQLWREPVIVCHGLGANRFNMDFSYREEMNLARALVARGFDVWNLELRGRGHAEVPAGAQFSVDDEVREDLPVAIETVLDLSGAERVLWVGHSKGGILQYLLHAERLPAAKNVAGVIAIGSPGTFAHQKKIAPLVSLGVRVASTGRPVPLAAISKLGLPIAELVALIARFVLPIGTAMDAATLRRVMSSLAADISAGVMRQFGVWFANSGALTKIDGRPYALENIEVPLFLIAGELDQLAPPIAVEHVRDRVRSKDVTLEVVKGFGHGDLVISARAGREIFPRVARWLEQRATPAALSGATSAAAPRPSR